ncbi:helix-turn-helix domain-containing protein [Achromobacter mucicolens]|uniref:Helix-turn-helix domain-containing protein n=1 Tax=Achromobacter mucicolens TaxID=1389922 RepID=A0ABD4YXF6_9BURK|nr:helix-turn-helix domain-containing protein [Achromobacter mucicolens]MDH1180080.1 helix-turn-helix domain-containing protein [Achromobacter mucicolens]
MFPSHAYPSAPHTSPSAVAPDAAPAATPARYLTNSEAAALLRLSPRTLEKLRVLGGGPRFRKFGRRVLYAIADLEAWADDHSYGMTSDPEYLEHRAGH